MSYCRFAWGGSDVYVYRSAGGIECCGCRFGTNFTAGTPEEMIAHLATHRRAGHFVPPEAIELLWNEIPGAESPRAPEPVTLTIASIQMEVAMMQARIEELQKQKNQEEKGQ
jgi:hypothetical protein